MNVHKLSTFGLAAAAGVAALSAPAMAEMDFTGKQVLLIVASNEGKGTDIIGRFMAQAMSKYLKGKPEVVVKNTGAGGGKIRGANQLAKAKTDGLTIMQSDGTTLQPTTLRRKSVRYDPTKFRAIGAINRGGSIFFLRKEAVARLTDKSKKPVIIGAISGTRSWQAIPMWGAEFLGWNVKWIPGYKGNNQFARAIRQGEIDAFATNSNYMIDPLVKEGVVSLVYQVGQPNDDGKYVARGSYPKVPIYPNELRSKVKLTKVQWSAYLSLVNPSLIDKWMALPPKTPKDIVDTWRNAYRKAFNDPELKKQMQKQFGTDLTLISGKRTDEMIQEVSGVNDEVVDYSIKLKQKYGLSSFKTKRKKKKKN
jgi:tripartite-type tricarboxylate transporter receptor subunit TctC